MKTIVSKVLAFALCIAFLAVGVSALQIDQTSISLNGSNQAVVKVTNELASSTTVSLAQVGSSFNLATNTSSSFSLGASESRYVLLLGSSNENTKIGKNTLTLNVSATNAPVVAVSVSLNRLYCDVSNDGDLNIDLELTSSANDGLKGWGQEDDEWYPGDEVEAEVEVENNGNEDVDNVEVEWMIYNKETGESILDDTESDFDVKDDDSETLTFDVTADIDDWDTDSDNYAFFVKATGEDDNGNDVCVETSQDIKLILGDDFVALKDLKADEPVSCPVEFTLSGSVWNLGADDQEDVRVTIYNKELGIDEEVTIGDVDALDEERLEVVLKASNTNPASKIYGLEIEVLDEDNDVFESDDEEPSTYTFPITVNCAGGSNTGSNTGVKPSVSAQVTAGGNAGEDLSVKTTITNVAATQANYDVIVSGYTSWATDVVISDRSVALAGGASREVTLTFKVKDGVEGEQSFAIELLSSGTSVARQPVVVTIGGKTSSGGFSLGDNWYLWAIAVVNIILVLAIIIVAVRIVRKRKEPAIDEAF